jgi:hypothetical protein
MARAREARIMMWRVHSDEFPGGGRHFVIVGEMGPVSYADVVRLWRESAAFRTFYNSVLAGDPFSAFKWETPPVTASTMDRPFEFVLLDSSWLDLPADPRAFAAHFSEVAGSSVVDFPNLGGDAILVAPRPEGSLSAYGHLAAFVRHAPEGQRHALWERVGEAMDRRLGTAPVWLSTAGAGVPWLHVRVDDRPKYYGYEPYRAAP